MTLEKQNYGGRKIALAYRVTYYIFACKCIPIFVPDAEGAKTVAFGS